MREQTSEELLQALEAMTVDPEEDSEHFNVSIAGDSFEALSLGFVRPSHALTGVGEADAITTYYQDFRMFAATRSTQTSKGDFVLLVVGRQERTGRLIDSAYRVYAEEPASLASNPSRVFQTFLERYAVPYQSIEKGIFGSIPSHRGRATYRSQDRCYGCARAQPGTRA